MKRRLTVGFKARLKEHHRTKRSTGYDMSDVCGMEVLLTERSNSGSFAILILNEKGVTKYKKSCKIIHDSLAWVEEGDLEFINDDVNTNLDFIDWYEDHECSKCSNFE